MAPKATMMAAAPWHDELTSAGRLPIDEVLEPIVDTLERSPNLILQAPPGAGKTTRVPLAVLLAQPSWLGSDGKIIVLEPRRIAARGAATRMATHFEPSGEALGDTVGYKVRHESRVSKATRIEVWTEGVLLRRLQSDPELAGVQCVMFDEYHERSLDADLALCLCRDVQQSLRPDLRLVVMSATLGDDLASRLSAEMEPRAEVLISEGRSYPVEIKYLGSTPLGMLKNMKRRDLVEKVRSKGRAESSRAPHRIAAPPRQHLAPCTLHFASLFNISPGLATMG